MIPRRTTLRDIQNRMLEKEQDKIQIYETILNLIYNRIETAIQFGQIYCMYQIPEVIPGKPLFNMTQCVLYIIHHFKQGGFEARYSHPYTLLIQWPQPNYMALQARTLAIENATSNDIPTAPVATSPTYSIPDNTEFDRRYIQRETQQRHRDNLMFDYIPKKVVR
jgi:hypothetical protein